jgi:pilus assembly protein CpaB
MKPKTIILMVVAVVCGLAASYMTSKVIAERNRNAASEEEKVTVLVAKQKLTTGLLIKDAKKYFVEKPYTKGEEPKKAIRNWELIQDKRLNKPLSEDQFVTADDLLDPKTAGGIENLLPPGMRAVALKVNAASVVAGFVLPNSRVDVVQVLRHGDQSSTQTILQNMLVLASDGMKDRPEDKQNNLASTVTLAAKPEDAQKLRLAEAIGELSLSLRGPEDQEITTIKATRPPDLNRSNGTNNGPEEAAGGSGGGAIASSVPDAPALPTPPPTPGKVEEAPAAPKTITQVIYNGESITKTVFVVRDGEISTQVEKTGLEREPRPEKKESAAKPETPEKSEKSDKKDDKKDADRPAAKAKPEGTK